MKTNRTGDILTATAKSGEDILLLADMLNIVRNLGIGFEYKIAPNHTELQYDKEELQHKFKQFQNKGLC